MIDPPELPRPVMATLLTQQGMDPIPDYCGRILT